MRYVRQMGQARDLRDNPGTHDDRVLRHLTPAADPVSGTTLINW